MASLPLELVALVLSYLDPVDLISLWRVSHMQSEFILYNRGVITDAWGQVSKGWRFVLSSRGISSSTLRRSFPRDIESRRTGEGTETEDLLRLAKRRHAFGTGKPYRKISEIYRQDTFHTAAVPNIGLWSYYCNARVAWDKGDEIEVYCLDTGKHSYFPYGHHVRTKGHPRQFILSDSLLLLVFDS